LPRQARGGREAHAETLKTAGLAAISGLRSIAGPGLLSRAVRRGDVEGLEGTPFAALGSPKVSAALQLLMVGEMIGDKMPFVPSRTSVPPLLGRALSGAFVGAVLLLDAERRPSSGAVLGALSAVAAAYSGEKLRAKGAENLGVPDPVLALLEDSVVLFGGSRLLRRRS
jgi:uncharacterized membrane protein